MKITERFDNLKGDKKMMTAVIALGAAGLLLILISSLLPEKKEVDKEVAAKKVSVVSEAEDYCSETEKRLESFLENIRGAENVRVYLTVGSGERYVYASEGKKSKSENKTEEEKKYVIIGSGSEKSALIETVRTPVIEGAVVIFSGNGDASVKEKLYHAVSAALGIPTGKIYVAEGGNA